MLLTDDIKPIYLGCDQTSVMYPRYYFYFIKGGIPRFLEYVTYFCWGLGPQTILSLVPIPEEVEIELEQFLSGNLNYEFIKTRKNSTRTSVKKVYRLPQQVELPSSTELVGGRSGPTDNGSPRSDDTSIGTGINKSEITVTKRKRRTKAEMQELKKLQPKAVMEVAVVNSEAVNVKQVKQRKRRSVKKS